MSRHCLLVASFLMLVLVLPADAQSQFSAGRKGPPSPYLVKPVERKPIKKHDHILVIVEERTTGGVDANLNATRKTEVSALFDKFIKFKGLNLVPDAGPHPDLAFESEVKTNGKGRAKRNDDLRARITAEVVEVLEDGTVRIEARKERELNDETSILILTGETKLEFVSTDSQLSSDRIANLRLSYKGDGPVSGRTGQTWLGWFVDVIWPF